MSTAAVLGIALSGLVVYSLIGGTVYAVLGPSKYRHAGDFENESAAVLWPLYCIYLVLQAAFRVALLPSKVPALIIQRFRSPHLPRATAKERK